MSLKSATKDDLTRNRLLATFDDELADHLLRTAELVRLVEGEIIYERGQHMDQTYFPLGPTTLSAIVEVDEKKSIEVLSIGREGALGGIISCGHAPTFAQVKVIGEGDALRVPMEELDKLKSDSAHLRHLFCRFADFVIAEIMQSVACNALHSIDRRAAGWLVTAVDRAGPRVELTQEAFAALLGAQRTTINAVARDLQDEKLIRIRRGAIEVIDLEGLTKRACPCHTAIADFFTDVIGESGSGSVPSDCA